MVHKEQYNSERDALARERQIKRWSRAKKEALIRDDFATLKNLAKKK